MKTKKKIEEKKLPKGFRFNANLDSKYADQPLFKEKEDKANHIIKTAGLPKF